MSFSVWKRLPLYCKRKWFFMTAMKARSSGNSSSPTTTSKIKPSWTRKSTLLWSTAAILSILTKLTPCPGGLTISFSMRSFVRTLITLMTSKMPWRGAWKKVKWSLLSAAHRWGGLLLILGRFLGQLPDWGFTIGYRVKGLKRNQSQEFEVMTTKQFSESWQKLQSKIAYSSWGQWRIQEKLSRSTLWSTSKK